MPPDRAEDSSTPAPASLLPRPPASPWAPTRRACLLAALAATTGAARATPEDLPIALSSALNAPFVDALLDELGAALGIRWQITRAPFTRVVRMAEAGEALGFGISPTLERSRTLDFTQAWFESGV